MKVLKILFWIMIIGIVSVFTYSVLKPNKYTVAGRKKVEDWWYGR